MNVNIRKVIMFVIGVVMLTIPSPTASLIRNNGPNGPNGPSIASTLPGWVLQGSGTTQDLYDVAFINSTHGWAVGDYGTILSTNNSGQTWVAQTSGTTKDLRGVDFVNGVVGWAVGPGILLKTTNGGQSWSDQTPSPNNLYTVDMYDANNGWVGGINALHSTSTGGTVWNLRSVMYYVMDLSFVDLNNGW